MRKEDSLIIRRVEYLPSFRELHIDADILRQPFMSPYEEERRFERNDFFEQNFKRIAQEEAKKIPQLS